MTLTNLSVDFNEIIFKYFHEMTMKPVVNVYTSLFISTERRQFGKLNEQTIQKCKFDGYAITKSINASTKN